VALDPFAIQLEKGFGIGWLKFSDDDIGRVLGPPAAGAAGYFSISM
jgi:hypothetical protein